jgi:DNA repair exonuclease SbcCD ATPase subunit
VTLKFSISRETQEGKIRNEITPIVSFGGHEAPLEASASGGQFTSIEIAVDLAVARVISRRTGSDLAWIILDESFNGHTRVEKESCLETLKEFAKDRLVLIVDHASEFKEMFTKTILVEKTNGRSKITEAA